jgi:hypothetical protein
MCWKDPKPLPPKWEVYTPIRRRIYKMNVYTVGPNDGMIPLH